MNLTHVIRCKKDNIFWNEMLQKNLENILDGKKVTNKEVLSRLDMKTTMLLQKAKALKLKYFGHIKRYETLERHILEARIDGRKGRGRPTRRWEQDINDWMDMTTTQAGRLAEDRILFRQKVQEATSRQEISWSRERENQPSNDFMIQTHATGQVVISLQIRSHFNRNCLSFWLKSTH